MVHFSAYKITVLCIGLAFFLLQGVLSLCIQPWVGVLLSQGQGDAGVEGVKLPGPIGRKDRKWKRLHTQLLGQAVGFIHNMIQVPLAFAVAMDPKMRSNRMHGVSLTAEVMMVVSSGFFLWDVVFCSFHVEEEGVLFLVHAVACFLTYSYSTVYKFIHFYGAAYLLWECSTPFVHFRWLLSKAGCEGTKLYTWNALCLMLSFFMARIVWGAVLTYMFLQDIWVLEGSGNSPGVKVLFTCALVTLNGLNWFWFSKMLTKGISLVRASTSAKQE